MRAWGNFFYCSLCFFSQFNEIEVSSRLVSGLGVWRHTRNAYTASEQVGAFLHINVKDCSRACWVNVNTIYNNHISIFLLLLITLYSNETIKFTSMADDFSLLASLSRWSDFGFTSHSRVYYFHFSTSNRLSKKNNTRDPTARAVREEGARENLFDLARRWDNWLGNSKGLKFEINFSWFLLTILLKSCN